MLVTLNINGEDKKVDVAKDTPLLWVIRDELNLTGTKFGCGVAACGACTVHVNGKSVRSCQTNIQDVEKAKITTIEGLNSKVSKAVQIAWRELNVVQCGYCQSGQIMSAVGLLSEKENPTDQEIDTAMQGNACRCATYQRIRAAIHLAASKLEA